jgi:soluble lytic murein transglycosylase-like protein
MSATRLSAAIIALWCGLASVCAAQVPPAAYRMQQEHRQQAFAVWGLAAPVASLAAQIHQESGWNCEAKSWVGALGCAQFMPGTAADMAKRYPASLHPVNPRNPRWAFRAQAQYMFDLYNGRGARGATDACERMAFAMAGYNGGEGWVLRDRALADSRGYRAGRYFGAMQLVNAGRRADAKAENAHYPQRILRELEPRYERAGFGVGVCA